MYKNMCKIIFRLSINNREFFSNFHLVKKISNMTTTETNKRQRQKMLNLLIVYFHICIST